MLEIFKAEQERSGSVASLAYCAVWSLWTLRTAFPAGWDESPVLSTLGGGYQAIRNDILHEISWHPSSKNNGVKHAENPLTSPPQ